MDCSELGTRSPDVGREANRRRNTQCNESREQGTWSSLEPVAGFPEEVLFKLKPEGGLWVSGFGAQGRDGPMCFQGLKQVGRQVCGLEARAVKGGDVGEADGSGPSEPCRSHADLWDYGCWMEPEAGGQAGMWTGGQGSYGR